MNRFSALMRSCPPIENPVDKLQRRFDEHWLSQFNQIKSDVKENEQFYEVIAELPGVDKENLDVEVKDNVLTVLAKHEDKKEDKNTKYHRIERSVGQVSRSFTLPNNLDLNNIDANFKNGVLNVKIPKLENESKDVKKISVK